MSFVNTFESTYLFSALTAYVFYPLENMLLCISVTLTAAVARERYIGMHCPINYQNRMVGYNPWKEALRQLCPIVIFAFFFSLPLFFESEVFVLVMPRGLHMAAATSARPRYQYEQERDFIEDTEVIISFVR